MVRVNCERFRLLPAEQWQEHILDWNCQIEAVKRLQLVNPLSSPQHRCCHLVQYPVHVLGKPNDTIDRYSVSSARSSHLRFLKARKYHLIKRSLGICRERLTDFFLRHRLRFRVLSLPVSFHGRPSVLVLLRKGGNPVHWQRETQSFYYCLLVCPWTHPLRHSAWQLGHGMPTICWRPDMDGHDASWLRLSQKHFQAIMTFGLPRLVCLVLRLVAQLNSVACKLFGPCP